MFTLLLILLPIVAGLAMLMLPQQQAKQIALIAALATLGVTVATYFQFDPKAGTQFVTDVPWINMLGVRFHIGIDGISMVMLILSNILAPLIILSSFKDNYNNARLFYGLMLVMQGAMNGVFVSMDMFLYYIFWELALIPAY
ncbi:MAG TPA: hypothetical protein PLB46_02325, partial [Chitinophagales bacterium]|nr:hypothetical protein [Chitinophagales bacterium]